MKTLVTHFLQVATLVSFIMLSNRLYASYIKVLRNSNDTMWKLMQIVLFVAVPFLVMFVSVIIYSTFKAIYIKSWHIAHPQGIQDTA